VTAVGNGRRLEMAIDAAAALFALALFGATLHAGPYPGDAAAWSLAVSGADPFPPLTHPLYAGLARWLSAVPLGPLSLRLGAFSALCAAACVVLIGRIVRALPPIEPAATDDAAARRLCGAVASVALAAALPFWFAATRVSPEPLSLLLMLAAFDALLRCERRGAAVHLHVFAALYVAAIAEHPLALYASPLAIVAGAVVAARRVLPPDPGAYAARFPVGRYARLCGRAALFALAGFVPFLLYAAGYARHPAAGWRQLDGYFPVVLEMARTYYREMRHAAPEVGWLLIAAFAAGPFLYLAVAPFFAVRAPFASPRPGYAFLCAALAAASFAMLLFDALAPPLAASLLGVRALPAAATAFTLGRLAAWWRPEARPRSRLDTPGAGRWGAALRRVAVAAGAALLLAAFALNGRLLRSANRQRLTDFARDAVRFMSGRHWLLTETAADDVVGVAAVEARSPLRLLLVSRDGQAPYLRYIAQQFPDVRLRDVARLGIGPLLSEWLTREPWGGAELAVFGYPEPWVAAGRRSIPYGPLTRGADEGPIAGLESLARRNLDFARAYEGLGAADEPWPWTAYWNDLVAARVSRSANSTGLLLEESGRTDLAGEAYAVALRVHPDNLSALLNAAALHEAAGRDPPEDQAARLREIAREAAGARVDAWALVRRFGDVRRPELFVRRGMMWALAGRARAAEAELRRAGAATSPLPLALAHVYLRQGRAGEGEAALREIVERDSRNVSAWLALFGLALHRNDTEAAAAHLDRAAAAGAPEARLAVERALLAWAAGGRDEARRRLRAAVRRDPQDFTAWATLAAMAFESGDADETGRAVAVLRERPDALPREAVLALARVETARARWAEAREALEAALRAKPGDLPLLEMLLRIDVAQARPGDALERVRGILAIDPGHAFANHVLGSIRLHDGDLVAAETALRRSVGTARTAAALNDLAVVLDRRGRTDEAIEFAREAVRIDPALATAWDTLGASLRRRRRLEEAEQALHRALAIRPEDPVFLWNLAQVYGDMGRPESAAPILDALRQRADRLPPEMLPDLQALEPSGRGRPVPPAPTP